MNNNFWNNKYLRNNILSSHIFLKSKFQAFPKIIIIYSTTSLIPILSNYQDQAV